MSEGKTSDRCRQ